MINVRAVGKIYPEFTFFLKENLHDAWKSDKSNGVAVCSAKQPEQRRGDDDCHCSLASDRKKDRRWAAALYVILLCDG